MAFLKIIGGITFLLGLLTVVGFPYLGGTGTAWQAQSRGWAGVMIGLFMMAFGIILIMFFD